MTYGVYGVFFWHQVGYIAWGGGGWPAQILALAQQSPRVPEEKFDVRDGSTIGCHACMDSHREGVLMTAGTHDITHGIIARRGPGRCPLPCFFAGIVIERNVTFPTHRGLPPAAGLRPVQDDPRAAFLIRNANPSGCGRGDCGTSYWGGQGGKHNHVFFFWFFIDDSLHSLAQ